MKDRYFVLFCLGFSTLGVSGLMFPLGERHDYIWFNFVMFIIGLCGSLYMFILINAINSKQQSMTVKDEATG